MSTMMRSNRKPPLIRSPINLRSRRVLRSNTSTAQHIQTPPGSLTKTQLPKRNWDAEELEIRPEYRTISCELRALAKIVKEDLKEEELGNAGTAAKRSPLFERGKFYEEYSARRNERLKRKKGLTGDEKKPVYGLGVRVESAKKTTEMKKYGSLRKVVPSTPVTERQEIPRYSLRSSSVKENKKPPLPVSYVTERKTAVRRTRKI